MMSDEDNKTGDTISALKQLRDEIELKLHLGGKDAQDEWARLEKEWDAFSKSLEPLSDAVKEAANSAGEHASKVGSAAWEVAPEELKQGYEKLRKLIDF